MVTGSQELYGEMWQTSNDTLMEESAINFQEVLETVHPIAFSCYYAYFEYEDTLDSYTDNFGDNEVMIYNAVHKLGLLYDTLYFLKKHTEIDRTQITSFEEMANYWYKLGAYSGLVFNIVLNSPNDMSP